MSDARGGLQTGKPPSGDGLSLLRRLLSEYHPDLTLSRYIDYTGLKKIVKEIEKETDKKIATYPTDLTETQLSDKVSCESDLVVLHDKFFDELRVSYDKVKDHLHKADTVATTHIVELKQLNEDQVRARGPSYLIDLYAELQGLVQYRMINSACFGKIMKKYFDRCAMHSLTYQRQLKYCDDRIADSTVSLAPFDISAKMDWILSVYGIVFHETFESASRIVKAEMHRRNLCARPRIVPMGLAYYYQQHVKFSKPSHGHFDRKLIAGNTSKQLGKFVGQVLKTELLPGKIGAFANGEVSINVQEAVRGDDVFILQSLTQTDTQSLSTTIMELCLLFQTMQLAAAARSTAVLPYLGYTGSPTAEISALAEMITTMGCQHVITVDMFNEQTEGFFDVPVENLGAQYEFIQYLLEQLALERHDMKNIVVVAPDSHTVNRARAFADALMKEGRLGPDQFVQVATAVRRARPTGGDAPISPTQNVPDTVPENCRAFIGEIDITGDVEGKLCLVVDCVLDEGVNLHTISELLKLKGAQRIKAVVTHALFSGDCVQRMIDAPIEELIVSDSIIQDARLRNAEMARKLRVLPLAPLIADAIERVHTENTLSTLFEVRK